MRYINDAGESNHVRAVKEVIVSAGAIKSPQLLQLSGIGPSDLLNSLDVSCLS